VAPGAGALLRTGVAVAVPAGHVGLVCDRSSLARRGLKTAGGVIDAGYRGELGVVVWNLSREEQRVKKGERAAQLLIIPIATPAPVEAEALDATTRGAGGFGSTGR
jgi:dUTP pyrophosphatase